MECFWRRWKKITQALEKLAGTLLLSCCWIFLRVVERRRSSRLPLIVCAREAAAAMSSSSSWSWLADLSKYTNHRYIYNVSVGREYISSRGERIVAHHLKHTEFEGIPATWVQEYLVPHNLLINSIITNISAW